MKILVACGTGIVCSSIIRANVERLMEENGFAAEIEQTAVRDMPEDLSEYDFLLLAMPVDREFNIPSAVVYEYLTGENDICDQRVMDLVNQI